MVPNQLALPASSFWRVLIALVTFSLLAVAVSAAPVAAGGGSISIGDAGADGEIGNGFASEVGSGSWAEQGFLCGSVYRNVAGQDVEFRTVWEFPLPALPAGALITDATLAVNGRSVNDPASIAIYGYAGDGATTTADATVTGSSTLVTPPASGAVVAVDYDVTDLVTPAMFTAGWAGFSLRLSDLGDGTNGSIFQCPTDFPDQPNELGPVLTITYTTPYAFTGFFAPVSNPDTINVVKAGAGVALKFSLGGDQGLDIFAAGSPTVQVFPCFSPGGIPVATSTAGGSTLSYAPLTDTYTYNWKTQKSWRGQCGLLEVVLDDGTSHSAYFKFK
jgi:hypothetical protein